MGFEIVGVLFNVNAGASWHSIKDNLLPWRKDGNVKSLFGY